MQHRKLRSTLHLPYLWAWKGQPVADTWLSGVGASGHMLQSCQVFCKPTALLGELSPTSKTWQRDVASPAGSQTTRLSPPGAHLYGTEAACGHAMPSHSVCFSESPPAHSIRLPKGSLENPARMGRQRQLLPPASPAPSCPPSGTALLYF